MPDTEPRPSFRCAVVQLRSTEDIEANLASVEDLVTRAATDGAEVVTLPENFAWLRLSAASPTPAEPLSGSIVTRMRSLASARSVHLLLGGFPERSDTTGRHYNTAVWIDPDGAILASYRKLHLFDIDIPGAETHRESDTVIAGEGPVTVETRHARFGLSICYDLRFPELYRRLAVLGAECLCVPSAFTLTTGKDHWHTLLRARAIENQAFVVAPAQWGHHGGKRNSYGHSLIIDPWGTVVCDVPDGPGYGIARLELDRLDAFRRNLPALQHRRADL